MAQANEKIEYYHPRDKFDISMYKEDAASHKNYSEKVNKIKLRAIAKHFAPEYIINFMLDDIPYIVIRGHTICFVNGVYIVSKRKMIVKHSVREKTIVNYLKSL